MYLPPHFTATRPEELQRIVRDDPLDVLVMHGPVGLDADHILTVRDDERLVRGDVARLKRRHEAAEPMPWTMADSAPEYIDATVRHIVGIEITLTSPVGKAQPSQNKELRERQDAADALRARGRSELARSMRQAT